jgi:cation diffusion facilitator CzcD-associated flavoprotein CzcO
MQRRGKLTMTLRYCIVGAGPAGLAQARAFVHHGIEFDMFERHTDVGGIWDFARLDSPIYESAHFISSKTLSGFHDFPMPDGYPDYPGHRQIHQYIGSFADAFGLRDRITFDTSIEQAVWMADVSPPHWRITLSTGEVREYSGLVCANGTQWVPNVPEIAGEFSGERYHSRDYRSLEQFRGKRVLVIGAGNSGVDIVCDAAKGATHAVLSMRRGYHVIPKHIFGMPADVFASTGPHLPMKAAQWLFPKLLRVMNGKPERYGLPTPDHKLFETHPILNSQILHYLSHGDLTVQGDVRRFDGSTVTFADGSTDEFDVVVFATGYHTRVPFLGDSYFVWKGNRPQLYMNVASREFPTLFAVGFSEGDGGAYELFDEMADLVANAATAVADGGASAAAWRDLCLTDRPDLQGGVRHVESDRHQAYLHLVPYREHYAEIYERLGYRPIERGRFLSMKHARRAPVA